MKSGRERIRTLLMISLIPFLLLLALCVFYIARIERTHDILGLLPFIVFAFAMLSFFYYNFWTGFFEQYKKNEEENEKVVQKESEK
jgi:hypothetical protein